jgi:hypothetical protein
MTATTDQKRMCIGADCPNEAGTLQCPTCLKLGMKESFFCAQDCFKRNWVCALHHSPNLPHANQGAQEQD